jgi:hypothetical protein
MLLKNLWHASRRVAAAVAKLPAAADFAGAFTRR